MIGASSYALLSVPFLALALGGWLGALASAKRSGVITPGRFAAATGLVLAVLLVLTAIFDNVIIGVGLVGYDDANRSGLQIGLAPIEDFGYSLAAGLGLPALWLWLESRSRRHHRNGAARD